MTEREKQRKLRRDRKALRYACFRLKTEADGGAKAPKGAKKKTSKISNDPWFTKMGGWKSFSETWDLTEKPPHTLIPLEVSIQEKWRLECEENAEFLPEVPETPVTEDARALAEEETETINIEI